MLHIINGQLLTMENENFENGFLSIKDGKIAALGDMKDFVPGDGDEVLDANGGYVTPGFIDAHCHIGMWEDGLGFEGDDGNEDTDPITPHLRAIDAVNALDPCFSEARKAGVTTVVTGPGSANVIGGQFVALKTVGKRVDDMVLKAPVAMKAALGENPKTVYHGKNQTPVTRMGTAALLREALYKAKEYQKAWEEYRRDPEEADRPEYDMKCEALLPVLSGELPLKVHAHRADDMFTALRIQKEFGIKLTLDHCTEGHLIADELAKEQVPVMVGPSLCDRSKPELKNLTFKTPGILAKKGLSVALITDHPVTPIQFLPVCAALAAREGLGNEEALRAITMNPAKNLGLSERVGSLRVGKDADVLVFDRYPLSFDAVPTAVFINGAKVDGQ